MRIAPVGQGTDPAVLLFAASFGLRPTTDGGQNDAFRKMFVGWRAVDSDTEIDGIEKIDRWSDFSNWGDSTPADATSYDVDKLNKELGITGSALGSSSLG